MMMNISWWVHILLKCKWFLPRISSYTADRENFLGEERTCSSFILLNRSSPDMLPFFHSQTMGPESMTSYELSGVCIYDRNHLTCSKFDFLQSYSYFDRHFFFSLTMDWIQLCSLFPPVRDIHACAETCWYNCLIFLKCLKAFSLPLSMVDNNRQGSEEVPVELIAVRNFCYPLYVRSCFVLRCIVLWSSSFWENRRGGPLWKQNLRVAKLRRDEREERKSCVFEGLPYLPPFSMPLQPLKPSL